jgi:uncharacterized membrane protein
MKKRSVDIFIVIALTVIMVALVFVVPTQNVPGRILTLPLVFILPGYAITSALFVRRELKFPPFITFTFGISLVIVVLGGLVLNLTPFGLRAGSWAVLLGAITIAASIVTLLLRQVLRVPASASLSGGKNGFSLGQGLLLGLAALIICGAFVVTIIGAQTQPYPGFTQLWMVPAHGASQQHTINVGVSNMESTTMEYRLVVNVNGKVVKEWSSIDLNPKQQWDTTLVLQQPAAGSAKVVADLYQSNAPTKIYRYVVLWLA